MLDQFKDYYSKAKKMQELKFQGINWSENDINDDLVWNIPIYDVVNRRYAAFSSFPEAVRYKDKDPKGNGSRFIKNKITDYDFMYMCYLFRLCGSGINYKSDHGFGNFWIVKLVELGIYDNKQWLELLPEKGFCDVKGYLLPMIPKGLRSFILEDSFDLIKDIINEVEQGGYSIVDVVNLGNHWLRSRGFKRQNFVLTAFAMDLAEYFPDRVDPNSNVLIGSNAKKCLKMIFPNTKGVGSKISTTNKCLEELCELTGNFSKKYDMEDVACDFIRYINDFQSVDHIKYNKGIKYENNVLK